MYLPKHYIKANNTPPGGGGDDLAEFRNQWKKELTVKSGDAAGDNLQEAANRDDGQDQDDDVHRKVSVKAKLDLYRNEILAEWQMTVDD